MKTYPALILLLCASASYSQSVYRCIDNDGKISYNVSETTTGCSKIDLPEIKTFAPPRPKKPISLGMSKPQVIKNWGEPLKVHRTQTRSGITEIWSYSSGKILTFANGSLEIIQD